MKRTKFINKILPFFIIVLVISSVPNHSKAVVFVPVNTMLETAPTAIKRTSDTTMLQVKNYVLDGLAWTVAKIMLQQVTASVVNWINSGFQGSPAFITDPGSFFADAADQITGAFISNTGALAQLCSPFSVDIRLALALQGPAYTNTRYTCTLSSVINNVKNSTVNVNGQVTLNGQTVAGGSARGSINGGATMEGFMSGDFSQGGWPAYVAMTTEPQNNVYGAFLQAKSDLEQQIANKQNNIRVDLSMGRGFMSWQKCSDVNADELGGYEESLGVNTSSLQNSKTNAKISTGQDYYSGAEYSLQKKVDPKTGKVSYKDCKTETPGSVIAGSIDKSLGIPQDTLNIAGSLNQIVGALFAQLVNKVLAGGLHSSSNGGVSGSVTAGVASQLLQEKQSSQLGYSKDNLNNSVNQYYSTASEYVSLRQQAVDAFNTAKTTYQLAASCFQAKVPYQDPNNTSIGKSPDQIFLESELKLINAGIAKVDAALIPYNTKLTEAMTKMSNLNSLKSQISNANTTDALNKASADYNAQIQNSTSGGMITAADVQTAQNDLTTAKTSADGMLTDAKKYQTACNTFTPQSSTYGGGYSTGTYFNGYSGSRTYTGSSGTTGGSGSNYGYGM